MDEAADVRRHANMALVDALILWLDVADLKRPAGQGVAAVFRLVRERRRRRAETGVRRVRHVADCQQVQVTVTDPRHLLNVSSINESF